MKANINWKRVLLMLFVCGGLILITHSFLMSLGIMLVLILIDALLAQYDHKHRE